MLTPSFKSYLMWQLWLQYRACCVCVCVCVLASSTPFQTKPPDQTREATWFCQRYYDKVSAEFENPEMLPRGQNQSHHVDYRAIFPSSHAQALSFWKRTDRFFHGAERKGDCVRLFKRLTMNGFCRRLLMLLCFWLFLEKHNGSPDGMEKGEIWNYCLS